jgi:hypothetical protein
VRKDAEALIAGRDRVCSQSMMKGYVAVPVRLPTGDLTGHIGTTEGQGVEGIFTFPGWLDFQRRPAWQ